MKKIKEYGIVDIYGTTHFFKCYNKKEARECFDTENGKDNFDYFTIVEKNLTEIDVDFLKELIATIERTIILIEDNKHIEDKSGFYNAELVLYELNDNLKYLKGEK